MLPRHPRRSKGKWIVTWKTRY